MRQSVTGKMHEIWDTFFSSFLSKNIILVQAIGICPIIAIGIKLKYGVVLTLCTAAIMLPASLFMSLFGDKLPGWLRAPVYTVGASLILLGTAVFVDNVVSHEIYAALYLFIPLMAVNTLVSYRAGGFSVSHEPAVALTDAVASTLGFGLVLCIVSALREIASFGTIWDIPLKINLLLPEAAMPYAAFILLGFMAAFLQWLKSRLKRWSENRSQNRPEGA